jgi:hypothetical protein
MPPLVVFVHVALLERSQERVNQYLSLMKKSGLLDALQHVYVDCVGTGELPDISEYASYPITVQRISPNLEDNEFVTQQHLWEYANENPSSFVLYLHTKGVGKEINPPVEDWVAYMVYFLIEKWQICKNVLATNKTVGVDLRPEFHLHYSGNFWWSRADFVKQLPSPSGFRHLERYPNALNSWRHNAEFWICYDKDPLGHVNLWSSQIPLNKRHEILYPRSSYTES